MNLYSQISANKRNSILLIVLLAAFRLAVVYIVSLGYGYDPIVMPSISLIVVGVYSVISYLASDKMVLSSCGAKEIKNKQDAYELFTLVENVCLGAGLPRPRIYIIEDASPNAFATGRDPKHASVCFTTGILSKLERAELEGVVAHELAHIKNY